MTYALQSALKLICVHMCVYMHVCASMLGQTLGLLAPARNLTIEPQAFSVLPVETPRTLLFKQNKPLFFKKV